MTALIGYNGGLLWVNGGLTADPNCCCYGQPPDCPPCCIRIDWGTFNSDGDLYDQYEVGDRTIDVKIVMPTKNSRVICDQEVIRVEWEIDGDVEVRGGWVRFGAGWQFMGESPPVNDLDHIYPFGLVDWIGVESNDFAINLEMQRCFLDSTQFHYFILVGMDNPEWELEIDVSRCPNPEFCCRPDPECEKCCWLIGLEDLIFHDDKLFFVFNNVDADGKIWTSVVILTPPETGKICIGDTIEIELHLVPFRFGEISNRTKIRFNGLKLGTFTPVVAANGGVNPGINAGDPTELDWGDLTARFYKADFEIECKAGCGEIETPSLEIENVPWGLVYGVDFQACDLTDCCPCETCDEGFDQPCCFGRCSPMTDKCTRIKNYEFVSYEVADDTPVNRFIQTTEAPYEDSGIYLGGCEFYMVYRYSEWDSELGDWGEESIVIDPDGFRYRNDGWYDGNAINAPIPGPCCGLVEGGYGPTNSGVPSDFYDQRYAVVSFEVDNPCDPECEGD